MPQPTRSSVHIDSAITAIAIAYIQSQSAYVSSKVFPIVQVDKQTNKYFKFDKDAWFRDEAKVRKSSAETAGGGFTLSNDSYSCDVFGIHKDIDDFDRANVDAPLDIDTAAAQYIARMLLLRQEIQWVTDAFTTGVWATDKVGTTDFVKWSDYAGSDPREDIDAGKESVLSKTGFEANTLVLGYQTFRKLVRHPDVVDQFKFTSPNSITVEMLARFLDIERVLVAKSVKNSAVENQTFSGAFVHGKNALLCYVNPTPSVMTPSAGYTFSWTGVEGKAVEGFSGPLGIRNFRMEALHSDRLEGMTGFDSKVVGSDLGYFFSAAVV